MPNLATLGYNVLVKKASSFHYTSLCKTCDSRDRVNFDPRAVICCKGLLHYMKLHAKLCSPRPYGLTHSLIHHFETVPNSKKLQTTTEMWLLKDFKIQIP